MMSAVPFSFPSEVELIAFFGAQPSERPSDTGYWCFDVVDARGVRLRFSFNETEQSVQTVLQFNDTPMITVAHEGAQSIKIENQLMTCRFSYAGSRTLLVLSLASGINARWSSLRTE